MFVRRNLRHTGVIALKYHTAGGNDAGQIGQRCEADAGNVVGGQPFHGAAFDVGFMGRRTAVGMTDDAAA